MIIFKKRVECVCCSKKFKDRNLATIEIKCSDGVIKRKICKKCEKILNEVSKNGK